ncbi:redoxin domain-containing protein [Sphingobacterium olei]|nr:redoxin domain-containing protein [Sphingobacterium olei]
MNKYLILIAYVTVVMQSFAQKNNTFVAGNIQDLSNAEWIYLSSMRGGYKDSTQQNDNGFRFELDIPEGEGDFYILRAGKQDKYNTVFIYLEQGKLHVSSKTASLKDAKFSGGNLAKYYNLFKNRPQAGDTEELYTQFAEAQKNNDTEKLKTLSAKMTEQRNDQKQLDKTFVLKHKSSPAVVYPLFFTLRDRDNLAELGEILDQLTPKAKNSVPIRAIEYSIKTDKLTGIGRTALPFSQADTAGNIVSINDFKGKYVLIDFWASWCVPCRVENPNVVAAFEQYKNKNFTVLGISFDNPGQRNRWIQAIHDDNLHWTQLSDLKGWKNEVGVLYDIKSIPSNLLIDPNGVIVAKNLKGAKLEEKLHELLGKPELETGTFVIKGAVENSNKATHFYTRYENADGQSVSDSVPIFDGVFSYIGKVSSPTQMMAYFGNGHDAAPNSYEQYLICYVEPGVVSLSGNTTMPQEITVSGSKTNDEYILFNNLIKQELDAFKPLNEEYSQLSAAYARLKKEGASETVLEAKLAEFEPLKERMAPYQKNIKEKQLNYIRQNPNSYISVGQLRYYVSSLSLSELQNIYSQVGPTIKNSKMGKEIGEEIAKLKAGSPGSPAKNFTGTDINGKPLQLTDYRGNYVLLDFWASWCVPCRKGNPHLLKLYNKYKKKGFEIIGISDDDRNHEAWKKAVDQDQIGVWKHVLRGMKMDPNGGFDRSEDKSEYYGVHTLPTKVLIDPHGVIVGRYAGGAGSDADLDAKLKEIFNY